MLHWNSVLKRCSDLLGPRVGVQVTREHVVLGSTYGAHAVCPTRLSSSSVVYSFGVGEDVSFDLELIRRFGPEVQAFDPTPRALAYIRSQTMPPEFHMNACALGTRDGTTRFFRPKNPQHVSHSTHLHERVTAESVEVDVRCLQTLMRERGHAQLDVLKLDIEGSEYEVLDKLCQQQIPSDQLLVEFHHQLQPFPYARTRSTIAQLNDQGYRVFYVSAGGNEISLIRV